MNSSPDIEILNKKLADRYGKNLAGEPHFRIVWTEDIFETRIGNFNEFFNGIFLRTYHGAKLVRKYNYIRYRWILEMWKMPVPMRELPAPDGYEPIFVFESAKGGALPPVWSVCEIICHTVLNPMDAAQIHDYIHAHMMDKDEKEREELYDMFDLTALSSLLHTKEAVSLKKGLDEDARESGLHSSEHSSDILKP